MQIIQSIREKGAAVVIVIIALSLIGFILMDARQGTGNIFGGGSSSNIGKVNGKSISMDEFNKKVQIIETQEEQKSGNQSTPARIAQIRDQVWNQVIAEKVFYDEAGKLGIDFTSKELSAVLYNSDPGNPLMQDPQMLDSATGKLDAGKVSQVLNNIKKMKGEQRDMVDVQIIEPQKLASISSKYFSLLNASAYYPAWMQEKDDSENKNFASISYVAIPYNVISDSAVKVTDKEIEAYVEKNKDLFKQEEGRMISFVTFSQLPSAEDSATARQAVTQLKNEFTAETNVKNFIARNSSSIDFDSNYLPKSKINSRFIDSITKLPNGTVYGPYVDQNNFVLAKLLGSKTIPDSVKARHILIPTMNPQTGQPIMEDSVAKKKADSIYNAIKTGSNFAALAMQFGSDNTKEKGGDLGTFGYGAMVPEFNEFCFTNSVGAKDVVKTQFGYHVIEITGQKGSSPAYKIAFMAKEILPSETTINNASIAATKLSAEKDPKKFEAYIAKNGLQKISMPTLIKENDSRIGQLQDARPLVRWVFEAKKGEVSEPFNIEDQFVVAIVDKVYKEGVQDVQTARAMAEGAVRNEKKAAEITKKLGNTPTLESAAAAFGKQVATAGDDSSITFASKIINGIGPEPKLIGACFNKNNQSKVAAPLAGKTGVYVFKVNSIATKGAVAPEIIAQQQKQQLDMLRTQSAMNWFEGLRKKATIKDNRSNFF